MVRVISVLLFLVVGTSFSASAQTDTLTARDSLIIRSREAMNRYFELRAMSRKIMDSIEASKTKPKVTKKSVKPKSNVGNKKNEPFRARDINLDEPSGIDSFMGAFYKFYNSGIESQQYDNIVTKLKLYLNSGLSLASY